MTDVTCLHTECLSNSNVYTVKIEQPVIDSINTKMEKAQKVMESLKS